MNNQQKESAIQRTTPQNLVCACKGMIDDTIEKLGKQLEQGISFEMRRYLKTMSLFPQFSLGNQILILKQKPSATHVAGFRVWKRLNRYVRKGEKGIRILAPCKIRKKNPEENKTIEMERHNENDEEEELLVGFRIVHVFDESQTGGKKIPQPSTNCFSMKNFIFLALTPCDTSTCNLLDRGVVRNPG